MPPVTRARARAKARGKALGKAQAQKRQHKNDEARSTGSKGHAAEPGHEKAKPAQKRQREDEEVDSAGSDGHAAEPGDHESEPALKRQRDNEEVEVASSKDQDHATDSDESERELERFKAEYSHLADQILQSREHYNSVATLLGRLREGEGENEPLAAMLSLCRVFCYFITTKRMRTGKHDPEHEITIAEWLQERFKEYLGLTLHRLKGANKVLQFVALRTLMQIVRDQANFGPDRQGAAFSQGLFSKVVRALIEMEDGVAVRQDFVVRYLGEFDDVRFHTFQVIDDFCAQEPSDKEVAEARAANILSLLLGLKHVPQSQSEIQHYFIPVPHDENNPFRSLPKHQAKAQAAWMTLLQWKLNEEQTKIVLSVLYTRIAPWFAQPEVLLEFLTDAVAVGGTTAILALSGLYYLIQKRNVDYPGFYTKLYALLDHDILHSRHRSRFFRLLDTCLASPLLPSKLVASFIKRLCRLALYAPPAATAVVVPWVYNLLQRHRACTTMIEREINNPTYLRLGTFQDPFKNGELNPMKTRAIASSLWELQMLQAHYQPNVATIANIVSEQFTKLAYTLEDFLDHSYGSMVESELSKGVKKPPVVEHRIAKGIFTKMSEDPLEPLDQPNLLQRLYEFDYFCSGDAEVAAELGNAHKFKPRVDEVPGEWDIIESIEKTGNGEEEDIVSLE